MKPRRLADLLDGTADRMVTFALLRKHGVTPRDAFNAAAYGHNCLLHFRNCLAMRAYL